MSSVRDTRQRAAARAKLERDMAARLEAARRRKLRQARIGAGVAGVLVIGVIAWIIVAATGGDSEPTAAPTQSAGCAWLPSDDAQPTVSPAKSGTPAVTRKPPQKPPTDPPRTGFQVITMKTNQGTIKVEMDLSKTPCTAASIASLAKQKFYDGSACHRLVAGIFALQCGDPTGTGTGGPGYSFADENLPKDKLPAYHEGDVAMANTGQPASNGSQFFFLWQNTTLQGDYSLFGRVIEGMDIIKKVAAGGDDGAFEQAAGGGHPKIPLKFTSVTVGDVSPTSAATSAPAASATTSSTATAKPTTPAATNSDS